MRVMRITNNNDIGLGASSTVFCGPMPHDSLFHSSGAVEKNRQEAINEVIYTERDFVRDMEYLRDVSI